MDFSSRSLNQFEDRLTGLSRPNTLRVFRASFFAPFPLVLQGLCRFSGLEGMFGVIFADRDILDIDL